MLKGRVETSKGAWECGGEAYGAAERGEPARVVGVRGVPGVRGFGCLEKGVWGW